MSNLREEISNALNGFRAGNLVDNARVLLESLGYHSEKRADLVPNTAENFVDTFGNGLSHVRFNPDSAMVRQWKSVDLLFQLAEDDLNDQMRLQVSQGIDQSENAWQSYLFFAIALEDRDKPYSRSDLAKITREINKLFLMPVMVIFQHGQTLTLAVIDRRLSKKYSDRDVLEKVTLIKDICFADTHTAHLHILEDLSQQEIQRKYKFHSFEDLHKAWRQVLNTSELNKRFYKDVSSWYFYACNQVKFPRDAKNNQDNLIRLITRLMFVWFLKEKNLVPDELFNERNVKAILKSLEPSESTYYKAILQNLFFATLNTEWGTRRFSAGDNVDQNHNQFLYESAFTDSQKTFKSYFETIPFLNGGLFECLDRKVENEPEVIIDGFGDAASSELSVPNELFFGDPKDVDLNTEFGTKGKKYKVQGIIRIFDGYKFTVTENTPLEQEVALDPELLGQVFENLLAAYNPETQTTARKQTGSFYTPREIVNYMVDESLIAYLKNHLLTENLAFLEVGRRQTDIFGNEYKAGQLTIQEQLNQNPFKGKEDELEQKLRQLLSFDDVNPFAGDNAVQERLIRALDSCKILDPACGSGAFPMGVLQKMVHILAKLDPSNARWRNQQKEKTIAPLLQDIQFAEKISYEDARDKAIAQLKERLAQIEADFDNNEQDYPRKLFLIENCIYGVDIQPIALQIAKLRCFIALIVEQKVDNSQPNRGILPLPNLETKFVAANSLIRFSDQMNLRSPAVESLERDLKEVRQKHFTARSKTTKDKYRLQDQDLRNEIGNLLKATGLESALADSLARWNPYKQNASADFFEAEWMFGINDGFDIVIGNPPYGKLDVKNQKYFTKAYKHQDYQKDMYLLFLERCLDLLKGGDSIISMIVPNTWLSSVTYKKIRKYLSTYYTWLKFLHVSTKVFQAVVDTHAFIFTRNLSKAKRQPLLNVQIDILGDNGIFSSHQITHESIPTNGNTINIVANEILQKIYRKILDISSPLSDYYDVFNGVKPFEKGKGTPPQTDKIMRDKPYVLEGDRPNLEWKPLLRGSLIQKYQVLWNNNYWILYGEWLAAPRNPAIFKAKEKICIRQTGDSIVATLISDQFIVRNNLHIVIAKNNIDSNLRFILGILNSRVMDFVYTQINPEKGEALAEVKKNHVEQLPIPTASKTEQKAIEVLVQKCLDAKGQGVEQWEAEIDDRVAHLYGLTADEMMIIRGD